jgi:hypothetical protein
MPHVEKYHNGVDVVPHDTLALLKRGEAVIPKKDNPMANADWRSAVKGEAKPKKEIKRMIHEKSHNGGHIVTHEHHRPEHHPDEKHTFSNMADVAAHMEKHAGTPNQGEPADASGAAPLTASPTPMAPPPDAGAAAPPAAGM